MEGHFVHEPQGKPPGKSTAGLAGRDSHICELPDFSRAGPVPYAMKFFPQPPRSRQILPRWAGYRSSSIRVFYASPLSPGIGLVS